jgi:3-phenylpropionate/trans-cinnamate dioxygenase ferredoxin reductase subunit
MSEAGMVIVGAGKAASRAVVGLREFGWQGPITLLGEESLPPYDRPPLSKASMLEEGEPSPVLLLEPDTIAALNATFLPDAQAVTIDRAAHEVVLKDGRRVAYNKLLICTGARARRLALPGAERAYLLRDYPDMQALRQTMTEGRSVAIVGGGFIGLELASSAVKRGCKVTVIEALPRILARAVPEEIAAVVARRHAEAGVTILTDVQIDRIEEEAVLLKDGTRVAAETLIAGIGAAPAVALAEAAGLALDNGIACDGHMRTSDPDIYASGDCASFPHPLFGGRRMRLEAWRAAADQASVATANMAGGDKTYEAVPWFWSDQYDLNLQIAGVPADGPRLIRRPLKDDAVVLFHLAEDGTLKGASGIGRGNHVGRDVRMTEMLIARRAKPDPDALANPEVQLKALLKG